MPCEVNSPQSLLPILRKGGRVAGGRDTALPTINLFLAASETGESGVPERNVNWVGHALLSLRN